MATTFGKLDFATSFSPLQAFPLDARTYFESLESAIVFAQKAGEAGSDTTTGYFGQLISVYDPTAKTVSVYKIVPVTEEIPNGLVQIDKAIAVGDLPIATSTSAGAVIVGENLSVAEDGTVKVNPTKAAAWDAKQNALEISKKYNGTTSVVASTQDITDAVAGLTGVLHFKGVVEGTELPDVGAYENGDIIIVGTTEYVLVDQDGTKSWYELGNEEKKITNNDVADGADIAMAKIAGLTDALNSKANASDLDAVEEDIDNNYVKKADATGYADILTKTEAGTTYATKVEATAITESVTATNGRIDTLAQTVRTKQDALATQTAHAEGLYKITTNALGQVTGATAVAKEDITALDIPGQDTTYTAKVGGGLTLEGTEFSVDTASIATVASVTQVATDLATETARATKAEGDLQTAIGTKQDTLAIQTAHAEGLYKITTNTLGQVTGATAVAKEDITALGIPAQDTTYTVDTDAGLTLTDGQIGVDTTKIATAASVTQVATDLAAETTRATGAEGALQTAIDGKQDTLATQTAHTTGLYKIETNTLGQVTGATAVEKEDITALGIPGQDTNYTAGNGLTLNGTEFSINTAVTATVEALGGVASDLTAEVTRATEAEGALQTAIDGKQDTLATQTAHAAGLYKIETNTLGQVTGATAVEKEDITNLGIPGQDTTYTVDTDAGLTLTDGQIGVDTTKIATTASVTAINTALDTLKATLTGKKTINVNDEATTLETVVNLLNEIALALGAEAHNA